MIEGKTPQEFREIDFTNTNSFKIDSMVVKNPEELRVKDADSDDHDDAEE